MLEKDVFQAICRVLYSHIVVDMVLEGNDVYHTHASILDENWDASVPHSILCGNNWEEIADASAGNDRHNL